MTDERPKPKQLLRPYQIEEHERTRDQMQSVLQDRTAAGKRDARVTLQKTEAALAEGTPQPVPIEERDAVEAEISELAGTIQHGMLSDEEMRRNPFGSVGRHVDWEKRNKWNIARYKELMLRTHIGSDDPDVASIERLRPATANVNYDNAQIPRDRVFSFPSEQYKRGWDDAFGKKTPEEIAAHVARLEADLDAATAPGSEKGAA